MSKDLRKLLKTVIFLLLLGTIMQYWISREINFFYAATGIAGIVVLAVYLILDAREKKK